MGIICRLEVVGHASDAVICAGVSVLLRSALAALARWPVECLTVRAQAEGEGLLAWQVLSFKPELQSWLQGWSALLLETLEQWQQQQPGQLRLLEQPGLRNQAP